MREAIEKRGAMLRHLPPYSPDLNPIENAFAKFKGFLRKLACRTCDALVGATVEAMNDFTQDHCSNFLVHANYVVD